LYSADQTWRIWGKKSSLKGSNSHPLSTGPSVISVPCPPLYSADQTWQIWGKNQA
jgi:hypothetical protein